MDNKDITNAELLESINKGFSKIDKRFSGIETSNQEILESIIRSFSKVENKMATKEDIFDVKSEIQDFRMDFKSFKKDTEHDIKEIKKKTTDLNDTSLHYDKRIEKLEDKVFA